MKVVSGVKETNGETFCEKCGADTNEPGAVKYVGHFDGAKTYGDIYNCKCGAVIRVTRDREQGANRFKDTAPKTARPGAKRVIWCETMEYDGHRDAAIPLLLPECPACHGCPTYNMEDCPFCGQPLDYSEKT